MAGKKNSIHYGRKKVTIAPFYQNFAERIWAAIGSRKEPAVDIIAQGLQSAYMDGLHSKER